jgi:hypothetical protein
VANATANKIRTNNSVVIKGYQRCPVRTLNVDNPRFDYAFDGTGCHEGGQIVYRRINLSGSARGWDGHDDIDYDVASQFHSTISATSRQFHPPFILSRTVNAGWRRGAIKIYHVRMTGSVKGRMKVAKRIATARYVV